MSINLLELKEILELSNIEFIDLQYTNTKKERETHKFRGRLAFHRSSLPARHTHLTPQLASQPYTPSIEQAPPSMI